MIKDLADQFIRFYWRQAAPFSAGDSSRPLRQNTGRQAAILNAVREARSVYSDHLGKVERGTGWDALLGSVERTVREMPLWKLQTVGVERLEFLYENREDENPREITLKPGVAFCFRKFYSLATEMVEGAWTQQVRIILPGEGRVWVWPVYPSQQVERSPERAAATGRTHYWWIATQGAFDVFREDGRWLGKVQLPEELRYSGYLPPHIVIRGDTVWARGRDSLDVQYVVRYRVVWPEGEGMP